MSLVAALVDLVLPTRCAGCGTPGSSLCVACRPDGDVLWPAVRGGPQTVAATAYGGAVRAALLSYKERGRRDLAGPLGALLARAVAALLDEVAADVAGRSVYRRGRPAVVLVPVPSSRAAAAARGGDHVLRLTRRAAASTGVRAAPGVLAQARAVQDSAGLDSRERAANLGHALRGRPAPPGLVAVVVDDIVTTGTTLREARRALVSAGWPVLGAAVVAATPLRPPRARIRPPPHRARRPESLGRSTGITQRSGLTSLGPTE
jgi:predicted amidophosphoribosyltransferase